MRVIHAICWVVLLVSCNRPAQQSQVTKQADRLLVKDSTSVEKQVVSVAQSMEDRILDTISKLPEVIKVNRYLDSLTRHQHGVALMIESKPTAAEPYYFVKTGYNGKLRFETYYIFRVAVKGERMHIAYLDVVNDRFLSLEQWRKESRAQ